MVHEVDLTERVVETLEKFEKEGWEWNIIKLEDIGDFLNHLRDRLKNHPGYKLRGGDQCNARQRRASGDERQGGQDDLQQHLGRS